jgi:hypothetical protein
VPPTTSSSFTSTTVVPRASLIDGKRLSLQLLAIQAVDRGLCFSLTGHLHESESSWLASEPVRYDIDGCDLPEGFKSLLQILFSDIARQVPDVDIHAGFLSCHETSSGSFA